MKKLNLFLLSGVCIVGLSGCSWLSDWPPSGSKRAAAPAPAPQTKIMQTADSTWIAPQSEQEPIEHVIPKPAEKGEGGERINALEEQVAQMRNDMSMMMPALTRLAEVQGDMQALLTAQIQPAAGGAQAPYQPQMKQTQASAQPVPVAPQSQVRKAAVQPQTSPDLANTVPSMPNTGTEIKRVRFGEHPDKTRIVLDISDEMAFNYDVDNGEQILMLELGADWSGVSQMNVQQSDLVAAYSAMPDGQGGTRMALQLKRPAQVTWAQYIPPSEGKGHRVVIDVAGI